MYNLTRYALYLAATSTLLAALLHFACIIWGAEGFLFLGAGEEMAAMAAAGHWYPGLVAAVIGSSLLVCSAYAISLTTDRFRLPFTRSIMAFISLVFLSRALTFPLLEPLFPGNSPIFWWVTSSICLIIALLYGFGLFGSHQKNWPKSTIPPRDQDTKSGFD